ncbi:sugar-binding transcriptional regulator [Salimicrobium album]|uniref:DNA-binding transcriptional regulator LsrR, DeoR family n=1 Tax=Salimicrobium album TaxID=50717 RepID=A0A1H3IMU1_9BACI|nr:sugar-binding transcriptional regulator [Salimicrobium album]SDY29106.1 DNA-binding transcriptional regulator LsrR, DeoR family [Salimicrobium album]
MNWNEERKLIKVAKMYYEENLTQNEIANTIGVYRTSVTRLLQKARDEGVVQITVKGDYRKQIAFEERLSELFNLEDVIVVPTDEKKSTTERKEAVGKAAVQLLDKVMKNGDTVGFAWGSTIGSMVDALEGTKKRDVTFVPLVGGPGKMPVEHHVNAIVYTYAKAYEGHSTFIDAAAVVPSVQGKKEIVNSSYFQDILSLWGQLSVAVVGIGAPVSSSNLVFSGFLGEEDYKNLESQHAVGDICSRFYDIQGNEIAGDLNNRTVAVELDTLKNVPSTIGVAESREKTESIVGALRGGFLTHLVTNDTTAEAILAFIGEERDVVQ